MHPAAHNHGGSTVPRSRRLRRMIAPLRLALPAVALMLALVAGLAPAPIVQAATISVPAGDVAALIAAINQANASTEPDTIVLASGSYDLTTPAVCITPATEGDNNIGLPIITGELTITGDRATIRRVSDDPNNEFRIIKVAAGASLTLSGLTVSGGFEAFDPNDIYGGIKARSRHGATPARPRLQAITSPCYGSDPRAAIDNFGPGSNIDNQGTLTLANVTVSGGKSGGAQVSNAGVLTVSSSVIEGGILTSGIENRPGGTLTVRDSTVTGNVLFGIVNSNDAVIERTTISGNGSQGARPGTTGGISNQGTLTVDFSTISGNTGNGIISGGSLTVRGTNITNNSAVGAGGGINNTGGTLTVEETDISRNRATTAGRRSQDIGGGGVANIGGTATIRGSTIAGNYTGIPARYTRDGTNTPQCEEAVTGGGGGVANIAGTMRIENSTVSGNTALASGGGVYSSPLLGYEDLVQDFSGRPTRLTIESSTVVNNEALSFITDCSPQLTYQSEGGGLFAEASPGELVNISRTVIAGNRTGAGGLIPGAPVGTFVDFTTIGPVSVAFSLIGNTNGPTPSGAVGSIFNVDPQLGPLQDNGGTRTHLPSPTSPLLEAAPVGSPPLATDQRGEPRPQAGNRDIGAVERPDVTPPALAITAAPAALTNQRSAALSFTASDKGGIQSTRCSLSGPTLGSVQDCAGGATYTNLPDGTYTFTVTATDFSGNVTTRSASWTIDTTPPAITISGAPGALTNQTSASLTVSVTDPSGIAGQQCGLTRPFEGGVFDCGSGTFTYTGLTDDGQYTFSVTATDRAGNTASSSVSWTVDTRAPTVTVAGASCLIPGDDGWCRGAVTATFSAVDLDPFGGPGSGLVGLASFSQSTSTNGAAVSIPSGQVCDRAGNCASAVAGPFKIDSVAPTVSIAGGPGPFSNQTSASFTVGAADNIGVAGLTCGLSEPASGRVADCAAGPVSYSGLTTDGQYSFGVTARDAAGNTARDSRAWLIDTLAPTVSVASTVCSLPGSDGWCRGTITATFSAADPQPTGISPGPASGLAGPASFSRSTDTNGAAVTIASGQVCDRAGNCAAGANTSPLKIDSVAPTVTRDAAADACSLPGDDGWCRGAQTAGFAASDATSGVAGQTSFTRSTTTNGAAVVIASGQVCDRAGNCADGITAGPYKIDSAAPTLTVIAPESILLNGAGAAVPSATDATSGVRSFSCPALDTSSVGVKTVTCAARDNAGNTAEATATYRVEYKFVGFAAPVNNGGVLNVANSGQTIPLKWRLLDANDRPVTNLASVQVTAVTLGCRTGVTTDQVEEYSSGGVGLQNLGNGFYQFNWKTPRDYARSCKTLRLDLDEGIFRTALFQFTR